MKGSIRDEIQLLIVFQFLEVSIKLANLSLRDDKFIKVYPDYRVGYRMIDLLYKHDDQVSFSYKIVCSIDELGKCCSKDFMSSYNYLVVVDGMLDESLGKLSDIGRSDVGVAVVIGKSVQLIRQSEQST